jgi:exopolysaccharide production protein ExoQ
VSQPASSVIAQFPGGRAAARGPTIDLAEAAAFGAAVLMVLAFTQGWVMFLVGPGPGTIDPAISAQVRNVFFPVYAIALGMVVSRPGPTLMAAVRSPALVLLILIACASVVWSIDPEVTLRRSVALAFTTLAGLVIGARFSWSRFLEVFAAALGITVVLSFLSAFFIRGYGIMPYEFPGAWRGVWTHKNTLGYYMSVSLVIFIASAIANPRRRWLWIGCAVGAMALILLSQSKTSLVSCLIGCSCLPLIALARRGPTGAVIAAWVTVSALFAAALAVFVFPDLLFSLVGKDATLTGRTQIWTAVMHQIAKRPVTGFGYGAVWDSTSFWGPLPEMSKEQGFIIHEAHNAWLAVWLELGYIGLVGWAVLFVSVWARAIGGVFVGAGAYFALPVLAVFSLHSVTEAVALGQNDLTWLVFSALAVKLATGAGPRPQTMRSSLVQLNQRRRPTPLRVS